MLLTSLEFICAHCHGRNRLDHCPVSANRRHSVNDWVNPICSKIRSMDRLKILNFVLTHFLALFSATFIFSEQGNSFDWLLIIVRIYFWLKHVLEFLAWQIALWATLENRSRIFNCKPTVLCPYLVRYFLWSAKLYEQNGCYLSPYCFPICPD